ncbi:MAG TPA: class I SAM-dependent methyltransferase [Burkholderiales bacterium]|nr:class I SAM-dependent methyltransferase [Burkholderiales bacterium]
MPTAAAPAENGSAAWFESPLGRYVLEREQAHFDRIVADVFGFNALQLGLARIDFLRASRMPFTCRVGTDGPVGLTADFHDLPIATGSIDLVLLPHVLEFSRDPHQILREVVRVLMPEGQLLICGFNPWSPWGARRVLRKPQAGYPWCGRFINLPRIKDWLSLLSFDVTGGKMACYAPPLEQEKWLRRFEFMEAAGDRWWFGGGGVYFLQAIKRVRGMQVILPKWTDRVAAKEALAPVPRRIHGGRVQVLRRRLIVLPGGRK